MSSDQLPDSVWQKMTEEERVDWAHIVLSGQLIFDADGNVTILAGKQKYDRMDKMKEQLIKKYA